MESQNASLDRNDGRDMRLPFGPDDGRASNTATVRGFVTIAIFSVDRLNARKRLGVVADSRDLAAQGRLVVF